MMVSTFLRKEGLSLFCDHQSDSRLVTGDDICAEFFPFRSKNLFVESRSYCLVSTFGFSINMRMVFLTNSGVIFGMRFKVNSGIVFYLVKKDGIFKRKVILSP